MSEAQRYPVYISGYISLSKKCLNLGDWTKRSGKHQAFTVPICRNWKALELGAWCLISEAFLYLSEGIRLLCWCLIDEVMSLNFDLTCFGCIMCIRNGVLHPEVSMYRVLSSIGCRD